MCKLNICIFIFFLCVLSFLTTDKSMIISFASIPGAVDGAYCVMDGNELAPL